MVRPMAFTPALGGGSTSSRKEKRKEERQLKITEVLTQSLRDAAMIPFERRSHNKGRSHDKDVAMTRT